MPAAKKSTSTRSGARRAAKRAGNRRRWVASAATDSTHPPKGLFTKSADTIAESLASKKVSPKGPASGMRMLSYFINRAGKGLPPSRRAVLEHAKRILSQRIKKQRAYKPAKAA